MVYWCSLLAGSEGSLGLFGQRRRKIKKEARAGRIRCTLTRSKGRTVKADHTSVCCDLKDDTIGKPKSRTTQIQGCVRCKTPKLHRFVRIVVFKHNAVGVIP